MTCRGSASPRHSSRKRSAIDRASSIADCGTGGALAPRADCATNDSVAAEMPGEVLAGLLVVDVDQLAEAPVGGEHRERSLDVDAHHAAANRQRVGWRRRQARLEGAVHQQAPDLLERDHAGELLDVDAAVAQGAAVPIGFGDLRRERDDALEARLNFAHLTHFRSPVTSVKPCSNGTPVRCCHDERRADVPFAE